MPLTVEMVAAIGFLLGPICRTIYDFLWELRDNPDQFDKRYFITMIISVAISLIVGVFYLPMIVQNLPEGTSMYVFASSFAQGFMLNHLINRPLDNYRKIIKKKES